LRLRNHGPGRVPYRARNLCRMPPGGK
jgi:hypothetical protein